ncbi:MAG: TraV family lipoprotein [Neisseria sp.]
MMSKQMKSIFALSGCMLLGGCSSFFNIGEEPTTCSVAGKGSPCVSVRAAYYASQGYDPDAQIAAISDGKRNRKNEQGNTVSPFFPQPIQNIAAGDEPMPLMGPTQVMRVWVNSYEDEQGNLVYPTRVYSEVTPRKWNTGYSLKGTPNKSRRVTPLVAKPDTANTENSPNKVAERVETQKPQSSREAIPDSLPQGIIPPLQ